MVSNNCLYMENGRYSTCDNHEHPHFYFMLTKGKARPQKNVVAGPSYLVIADVPMPIGLPFGFFPFNKSYSSGIIMRSTGKRRSVASTCAKGGITSPSTTTSTWLSRGTGIASAHGASMPAQTTASATASGGASTSATSRPRRGSAMSSGTSPRAVTSASTGRIHRTPRPTPTRPSRRA